MRGRGLRTALAVTAVGVAAAIAYAPSFAVPFQFDDYARLGENWDLAHGSLIEALRWLGKHNVDDQAIAKLKRNLKPEDKAVLLEDAHLAPAWIAAIFHRLAGKEE